MDVLIFENNLMWSARLRQTLVSLGHEVQVIARIPEAIPPAEVAIVNLDWPAVEIDRLLPVLQATGAYVIGHAGHKEQEKLEIGRIAGCDQVVSNSTITFKLPELLEQVSNRLLPQSDR